jgi:alcohol dehydrogenase (NADP+)
MEQLVDDGLVRHIGVSNFTIPKLQNLLAHARVQPAVHQCEMHPLWRHDKMLDFYNEKNIHVTAYSPLGHANLLQHPLVQDIASEFSSLLFFDAHFKTILL